MQAANPAAEDAAEDAAKDAAEDAAKPAAEPAAKDADRSPTPDLVTPPRAPWMTSTPDRSSGSSPALTPSPTPSPTPGSSPDSTPVLTPASTPGKGWQSPPEGLAEWALEPEAEYYLKRQREDKESSDEDEESSDEDEESSDEDEESSDDDEESSDDDEKPIPGLAEHFRGKRQRINESATEVSGPLPRPLPRKTIFDLLAKGIERGFELSAHQTWGKVTK